MANLILISLEPRNERKKMASRYHLDLRMDADDENDNGKKALDWDDVHTGLKINCDEINYLRLYKVCL